MTLLAAYNMAMVLRCVSRTLEHPGQCLRSTLPADIAVGQRLDLYVYKIDGRGLHSAVHFLAETLSSLVERPELGLLFKPIFIAGSGGGATLPVHRLTNAVLTPHT